LPIVEAGTLSRTLTLQGSNVGIFNGAMVDPSGGSLSLIVAGGAQWTLSGANTYSGSTTINPGATITLACTALPSTPLVGLTPGNVQAATTPGIVVNNGTLNVTGTASVGTITGAGSLNIGSAALLQMVENQSVSSVNSFTLSPGGTLDITNNILVINYAAAGQASPDAAIRAALVAGSGAVAGNGTTYTGAGILSSTAARLNAALVANGGTPKYGVGYADGSDPYLNGEGPAAGTEEVKLTLLGDLNLDGVVNSSDFVLFANSFGQSGASAAAWDHGDLNYDGNVNSADFILFADNFGQSLGSVSSTDAGLTLAEGGLDSQQLAQFNDIGTDVGISSSELAALDAKVAAVPEPATCWLMGFAGLSLFGRRRRRHI
jgi:autotransporter-associated beta strand protein